MSECEFVHVEEGRKGRKGRKGEGTVCERENNV